MKARDFDGRFEQTLIANKLEYTKEVKTETLAGGLRFDYQDFKIKAAYRNPPVVVQLTRITRPTRFRSIGRRSHSCFVIAAYGRRNPVVVKGLRGVWQEIQLACFEK